jgi:UDP-N-acetylglucosamine 2-epimerase (non-hydrolysing)
MKKLLIVFGTRPEAIKMAPLVNELKNHTDKFIVKVCVTGQHRQMLDQVLQLFSIHPDYDLDVMKEGQDLYDITTQVLLKMKPVLDELTPDLVLVHGDTTTAFAAALAAYYRKIQVGHVEAGLRTGDKYAPFPEEMNRTFVGSIASMHFAPTELSKQNLLRENIDPSSIIVTGNTVIDALQFTASRVSNEKNIREQLIDQLEDKGYANIRSTRKIVLITGHRRENFGQGFIDICNAIKELAHTYPAVDFVYPVHLNPNVQQPVRQLLSGISNVFLIAPLEYEAFIFLLSRSYIVLTDSGGIQEEAPGLGKPVLVMREVSERPEAIEAGTVRLVGTDKKKIVGEISELLDNESAYHKMSRAHNPYGDGHACERIAKHIALT